MPSTADRATSRSLLYAALVGVAPACTSPMSFSSNEEGGATRVVEFDLEVIDDVEGEFPHILESGARNGFWFVSADGSGGNLSPLEAYALEPPRGDSYYAARISGAGFTTWGAAIAITLKAPLAAYDASAYCGVRTLARGDGDGWAFMTDHFGKRFQPTDDWQEHLFTFDELELVKGSTGQERAFESHAIFSLQFVFDNASGADFELMLDDVAFMVCEWP